MTKIAVFVGSLSSESINQKFAHKLEALLPEGTTFEYANLDLPLFDQDKEGDYPAAAQANKDLIEAADGVLFITPEYNRSVPGVLKNAIDWASRPWGTNSFDGKPVMTTGVSIGSVATVAAQQHLKNILAFLNMKILGQPEAYFSDYNLYDEEGNFHAKVEEELKSFLSAFIAHVEANAADPVLA